MSKEKSKMDAETKAALVIGARAAVTRADEQAFWDEVNKRLEEYAPKPKSPEILPRHLKP